MASSSWKWRALALFVALVALVVVILALFLVHADRYTNMSAAQADAQDERWVSEQVAACHQAGGDWQASLSSAYCNVSFQPPDTSWYVTPVANPNYELWQMTRPLLGVLACGLTIIAGKLSSTLFLCLRTGKKNATVHLGR